MLFQSTSSTTPAELASIANMSELYRGADAGQDESVSTKLKHCNDLRRVSDLIQIFDFANVSTLLMSNHGVQAARLPARQLRNRPGTSTIFVLN